MEAIPLVMEPTSDFYTSPVVVLDYQVELRGEGGVCMLQTR